jgi:hypothetical protein
VLTSQIMRAMRTRATPTTGMTTFATELLPLDEDEFCPFDSFEVSPAVEGFGKAPIEKLVVSCVWLSACVCWSLEDVVVLCVGSTGAAF